MGKQLRSHVTGKVSPVATIADVEAMIAEALKKSEPKKKTSTKTEDK